MIDSIIEAAKLSGFNNLGNIATKKDTAEGFGYLVDVYDDYIVLRGRDFVRNEWSGIGTFKITK